jgi:hypothetical protein
MIILLALKKKKEEQTWCYFTLILFQHVFYKLFYY